jgi:hypothetical protein
LRNGFWRIFEKFFFTASPVFPRRVFKIQGAKKVGLSFAPGFSEISASEPAVLTASPSFRKPLKRLTLPTAANHRAEARC